MTATDSLAIAGLSSQKPKSSEKETARSAVDAGPMVYVAVGCGLFRLLTWRDAASKSLERHKLDKDQQEHMNGWWKYDMFNTF